MEPPRHYSVSPLHSFVTVPTQRAPSLAEMIRAIIAWWRGTRPTFREQVRQAKIVAQLAAEMEAEAERKPKGAGVKDAI